MRLHAEVATADTDYGTILLDQRNGRYWQLNETGTLIVRTLLDGGSVERAAHRLAEEYDIGPSQAEHDVRELVSALDTAGLVVR